MQIAMKRMALFVFLSCFLGVARFSLRPWEEPPRCVPRGVTLAAEDIGGYTESELRELLLRLAPQKYRAPV